MLKRINRFVEGLLEREISPSEREELRDFVRVNKRFVSRDNDIIYVAELANAYVEHQNKREGLEIKERQREDQPEESQREDQPEESQREDQKHELGIGSKYPKDEVKNKNLNLTSFMGLDTFDRFISEINPLAKRKRAYMCLDSRYARFNQECTRLTWEFTNNLNVVNNSTNVVGPVRDITWIRMHSMVVRKFNSVPQRATILIEELSAQSFIMPSGRRFHFVGLLNDLQNPINFGVRNAAVMGTGVPDFTIFDKYELLAGFKFNDGFYRFNKPITTLNEITVSIGNPDTLVVLPKYEFLDAKVINANAGIIDIDLGENHYYISPNSFYFPYAGGTWYSVFVDGFTGGTTNYNNAVNSFEFTIVSILSPTTIRLSFSQAPAGFWNPFPPTVSVVPGAPAPADYPRVRVRFNSYRVIMNFEMEYISP